LTAALNGDDAALDKLRLRKEKGDQNAVKLYNQIKPNDLAMKTNAEMEEMEHEVQEAAEFERGVRYINEKIIGEIKETVRAPAGPMIINIMEHYKPSSEVGMLFRGHGSKLCDTLSLLLNLLTNGIHKESTFYTGVLSANKELQGIDQSEVHYQGDYILATKP